MAGANEQNHGCGEKRLKKEIQKMTFNASRQQQERADVNKRKFNLRKTNQTYDNHPHGENLSSASNFELQIMERSQLIRFRKDDKWWIWHTFKIALVDNVGQILQCRFTKVDQAQDQPLFLVRPSTCHAEDECAIIVKANITPSDFEHQVVVSLEDHHGKTVPSECGQFILPVPEESKTDCLIQFQAFHVGNPSDLRSTTRKVSEITTILPGKLSLEIDIRRKEPSGLDHMMDSCFAKFCRSIDRMDNSSDFSDIKALIQFDAFAVRAYFKGDIAEVEDVIRRVYADNVLRETLMNCNLLKAVMHRMIGSVNRQNGKLEEAWHHLQLNCKEMMFVLSAEDQVRLTLEKAMYYHERHMHDKIIAERQLEKNLEDLGLSKKQINIKGLGDLDPLKMSKNLYDEAYCQSRDYILLRIMVQLRLRRVHINLGTSRGTAPKPNMVCNVHKDELRIAENDIEWIWSCIENGDTPVSYTLHVWFSIAESDRLFILNDFTRAYAYAKHAFRMARALDLKIELKGSRKRMDQLEKLNKNFKHADDLPDVKLLQYFDPQNDVEARYEMEFSKLLEKFETKVENMNWIRNKRVIQHPTD